MTEEEPHVVVERDWFRCVTVLRWTHNPEACREFSDRDRRERRDDRDMWEWVAESAEHLGVPVPPEWQTFGLLIAKVPP